MGGGEEEEGDGYRVVELYSGIGGMRYALKKSGVKARIIQAWDINERANDVYQHNFSHRPSQTNIQTLTPSLLDLHSPHAWLLSPPCQPYTRTGLRKHSSDHRSSSLLHLLRLLPLLRHPPSFFLLENVLGFETSDTHHLMLHILSSIGFSSQHFSLSPSHFLLPYSRPRYFCLARRTTTLPFIPPSLPPFSSSPNPLSIPHPPLKNNLDFGVAEEHNAALSIPDFRHPLKNHLDLGVGEENNVPFSSFSSPNPLSIPDFCHPLKNYLELGVGQEHNVPLEVVERRGGVMDVVFPDSKRCCCFTKSYSRYIKGTGSVLCFDEGVEDDDGCFRSGCRIRYFTPREVANLHSFPPEFDFPEHVSLRQRYALLGNSLSVAVVAPLITHLFSSLGHLQD